MAHSASRAARWPARKAATSTTSACIEPFDEAAIRALMARHGVPVHGEVQNNFGAEGNGPSIYITDPDGNSVELKGPAGASF